MRVLVGCEYSGRVSAAFRRRGHVAFSCDLLPAEGDPTWHIQGSVLDVLGDDWDLAIFHPPCTYLANSGARWLYDSDGELNRERWNAMEHGAAFYRALRDAPIPKKCIENPVMHKWARAAIGKFGRRQIVQPWWFGEPYFKATGFELIGLPDLVPTNKLIPPKPGTPEHKAWSAVHRASPGPDRWKDRSRTYVGVAEAMAAQWS